MNRNTETLVERDRRVIWHPYSQHGLNQDILPVVSAQGAYLKLADGRRVLDAISSWWVNIHGHSHPTLVEAIQAQAKTMEHVLFAGFTHEPAVSLAELLIQHPAIQKSGLCRVFYSDNGSTAVEVALKMSFQYYLNQGKQVRNRFIALSGSYHGDTLGAMAVGEPSGFHSQFRSLLPQVDFVDPGNLDQLQSTLEKYPHSHSAFIFEPLVQGAAGMKMYEPSYLKEAVRMVQSYGVRTICDEVFTGFYRTGTAFAFEQADIRPDLMCLSKGITGGFLPLAVTLANEEIYSAFLSKEMRKAFLHGHSYTANPLACAAGIASWQLLQNLDCQKRIALIQKRTETHIKRLKLHPLVLSAKSIGTIGAIELRNSGDYFSNQSSVLLKLALAKNVLLRPLGNVLYSVPPYCCTEDEIDQIYETMQFVLESRIG